MAQALSTITNAFFSPSPAHLKQQVRVWCGVFVGIGGAALLAGLGQGYCFTRMGAKLTRRIRVLLMMALMRQARFLHLANAPRAPTYCMLLISKNLGE